MLQEELFTGMLEFTPCFANMTNDQGDLIIKAMEYLTLKAGEFLVKDGEINDNFYSLEEGKLGDRTQKDSPGENPGVDEVKGGVLFYTMVHAAGIGPCPTLGYVALIKTTPSVYYIVVEKDCTLWSLHCTAFQMVRSEMYSESDSIGNESLEVKRGSYALYQNTVTAASSVQCM
jgi:CRP-like cAMP-binding protein